MCTANSEPPTGKTPTVPRLPLFTGLQLHRTKGPQLPPYHLTPITIALAQMFFWCFTRQPCNFMKNHRWDTLCHLQALLLSFSETQCAFQLAPMYLLTTRLLQPSSTSPCRIPGGLLGQDPSSRPYNTSLLNSSRAHFFQQALLSSI